MIWIWQKEEAKNSFVEFKAVFDAEYGKAAVMTIGSDHKYAAYINGQFVSNGQYADMPDKKCMNTADVTPFLDKTGKNELVVLCRHMGEDYAIARTMPAAMAFEIVQDGRVIARSDSSVLCRSAAGYYEGDRVTPQIGDGYNYDFTAPEKEYENAVEKDTGFTEIPRPIKPLIITEPLGSAIQSQGIFRWQESAKASGAATKMQTAWLAFARFSEMTGKERMVFSAEKPLTFARPESAEKGDGLFVVADMGRETCGHLTFSLTVDEDTDAYIGWGEHLADLRVRTERAGRNFGTKFTLRAGENNFDDYLCRIGGRYICLFVESEKVTIGRLSVRETVYPFDKPEKSFGDRLLDNIYETGRRTLELCAHEHYEDCPWREQALYGMDSRNQMLFGYGAFGEYEYPRAALKLFAYSLQDDGMVQLCSPARAAICIPSFTAYWLIAIGENAEADYNDDFVREVLPYAERALDAFFKREQGGMSVFTETPYWNFHEWSDGLDGGMIFRDEVIPSKLDCNLTALTLRATEKIAALEERTGNTVRAAFLKEKAASLAASLEKFYDAEKGLYASYITAEGVREGYHAYTQAVVLSTGQVCGERRKALCAVLREPSGKVVDITLAGLQMKYDALLSDDADGENLTYCIDEIVNIFGSMLLSGATSYWETANGESDFDDAGSLCHGWSSVACYVFDRYLSAAKK